MKCYACNYIHGDHRDLDEEEFIENVKGIHGEFIECDVHLYRSENITSEPIIVCPKCGALKVDLCR
jgi:hypothetical protein